MWRDRVGRYLNLEHSVRHAALEAFVAEEDGINGFFGINNFFLYRPAGSTRHRFIVWDKDSSFVLPEFDIFTRLDQYVLFRRALEFSDLRRLYLDTLERAALSAAEDRWLEKEVARLATLVTPVVREDARKPFSTDAFLESIDFLRDFAERRSDFVLREVNRARRGR